MWTEAARECVRTRWNEGFSATQIARFLARDHHITKSRNAVIGVVFRAGLSRSDEARPQNAMNARAVKRRPRISAERRRKPEPAPTPEPVEPLNVPFLDRQFGQCCAITDAARFAQRVCGHPVAPGDVYCPAHRFQYTARSA